MPSDNPPDMNSICAVYTSPASTQTFEQPISSPLSNGPPTEKTRTKTAYLAELRQLVPKIQTDVNVFLTERMEEDKKAAEAQGRQVSEKEAAEEEENYGEENVEEDS